MWLQRHKIIHKYLISKYLYTSIQNFIIVAFRLYISNVYGKLASVMNKYISCSAPYASGLAAAKRTGGAGWVLGPPHSAFRIRHPSPTGRNRMNMYEYG
jgi:hypothetical protein